MKILTTNNRIFFFNGAHVTLASKTASSFEAKRTFKKEHTRPTSLYFEVYNHMINKLLALCAHSHIVTVDDVVRCAALFSLYFEV
jgi:hypothetical protein